MGHSDKFNDSCKYLVSKSFPTKDKFFQQLVFLLLHYRGCFIISCAKVLNVLMQKKSDEKECNKCPSMFPKHRSERDRTKYFFQAELVNEFGVENLTTLGTVVSAPTVVREMAKILIFRLKMTFYKICISVSFLSEILLR